MYDCSRIILARGLVLSKSLEKAFSVFIESCVLSSFPEEYTYVFGM